MRAPLLTVSLLAPLLLIACAGPEGQAPSLSPRPVEGILDEPVRGIAPVASTSDPALAAQIDALLQTAEAGEADFNASYESAARAVQTASGRAVESEAWIEAQLAVSALDSARSQTSLSLGSLDAILAEQTLAGAPSEADRLTTARDRVAALYEGQAARYEALNGQLSTR